MTKKELFDLAFKKGINVPDEWSKQLLIELLSLNISVNDITKKIVSTSGINYWMESLIQNYAYTKLPDKNNRHRLAYENLKLPLPKKRMKKDDVQSLLEAHYHDVWLKNTIGHMKFSLTTTYLITKTYGGITEHLWNYTTDYCPKTILRIIHC